VQSDGEMRFKMIIVDCATIRDDLCYKANSLALGLLTQFMENTTAKNEKLQKQFEVIDAVLQK